MDEPNQTDATGRDAGRNVDDGFSEIDEEECKRLLREEGVGILGMVVDGEVELRPVNYAVHRASIIVRTDRGLLFESATHASPASLAVMSFDSDARSAWSVIAKGRLSSADAELEGVQLFSWAHAGKSERIRLSIDALSGRRLAPKPAPPKPAAQ